MRLSIAQFESIVDEVLKNLPEPFARLSENVEIHVENAPSPDLCAELDIDDPHELMGLYCGTPLTERGIENHALFPDRILLFKSAIEDESHSAQEVAGEIRKTLLHELGHHFGLDESDLEDVNYD